MATYRIDKNIPIYPRKWHGVSMGRWQLLASQMEEGDSVQVNSRNEALALLHALRKSGFNHVVRNLSDHPRVWKLNRRENNQQ